MNRRFPGALALVTLIALSLALAGCGSSAQAEGTIGVNSLTADPQAFVGTVAVKGIVQDVQAELSMMRLIDVTEYETCGLTPCGSAGVLPVHVPTSGDPSPSGALYDGELPQLEDEVIVTGTIRSGEGGLFFDVDNVARGSQTLISKR